MAKMGWQKGGGLGARGQGMTEALSAKAEGGGMGRIVGGARGTIVKGAPSRCVLLTNMVGPGEVDDMLEVETRQECEAKYGSLGHCVVHELRGDVPPDQAVRIFVMFDRAESAMKAVIDLHGRFFGGREVKAIFFDEDKFHMKRFDPEDTE